MFRRIFNTRIVNRRWLSANPMIQISEEVNKQLENEEFNPKKHPGILKSPTARIPEWVEKGISSALSDHSLKNLREDGKQLALHLHHRHTPPNAAKVKSKLNEVKEMFLKKIDQSQMTEEDMEEFWKRNEINVQMALKERVYAWAAIEYDDYKSLCYLMARGAQNYAVLCAIFSEISHYDKNFKPKNLFDFGSGVGTVVWAASQFWEKSIGEYYCVDSSADMNTLAETIIGKTLKNVYFRQFLPSSARIKSDIVVSAFSLFEMPNAKARLNVILNLWEKTNKYLIIVEEGTNAGFKVVNEARDFILDMSSKSLETENPNPCHVFAPCPHDTICPRYVADRTPCNFLASYFTLPFGRVSEPKKELYSYVVMRKGKRSEDDEQWPRIVRPTMIRSKHTICKMCTAGGALQDMIFTASKHGKHAYKCARYSNWGDKLPLKLLDQQKTKNSE